MAPVMAKISCDIFCTVVDNYGDIGVSWRLARQLAREHAVSVRLWLDDLRTLQRLCPELDTAQERQVCREVEVVRWRKEAFPDAVPADLVIEAFACELPESYIESMAGLMRQSASQTERDARRQGRDQRDRTGQHGEAGEPAAHAADASLAQRRKPVWINLEYLSAEDWVDGCHKLPSPRPNLPLVKYFFFPGFTRNTGGLLLERDLLARRNAFQGDPAALAAFWQGLNLAPPEPGELRVSLFSYENHAIVELLGAWAAGGQPLTCLVPEGRALPQVARFFGAGEGRAGAAWQRGNLRVQVLPFVEQARYDELLWACDVNFVRGEDSFVRAQWAGKPLIWQIYPQHDGVHMQKLRAFLGKYCAGLPPEAAQAVRALWEGWNGGEGWNGEGIPMAAWNDFAARQSMLAEHARAWAQELSGNSLALNLLDFFREIGKMRDFEIEQEHRS
jgi:uncharacterized repeat protein (TIGR03837 family)